MLGMVLNSDMDVVGDISKTSQSVTCSRWNCKSSAGLGLLQQVFFFISLPTCRVTGTITFLDERLDC